MHQELCLPSPAKLNLFLHITGRREDGYHELQTLFQFIDYADELCFSLREDDEILLSPPLPGVAPADNLIIRAAHMLRDYACSVKRPPPPGVDISLLKRLPMGGGLGGGSSNAATTLVALNTLWDLSLDSHQLQRMGLSLGADVPVFIAGEAAWAEGVGEKFSPVQIPEPWYLIVVPNCTVSTAAIFSHKDLTRDSRPIKIAAFLEQGGRNDCEKVVRKLHPEVDKAMKWLDNFSHARLTGTGACVFAEFADESIANDVLQQLPAPFKGFVAKGLNVSPLKQAMAKLTR